MNTMVYLYREAYEDGVEFRYSLRSVAQNYHPEGKPLNLVVVGDRPSWLSDRVTVLEGNPTGDCKSYNIAYNANVACKMLIEESRVIFCDDDYFLLEPVTSIPVGHAKYSIFDHILKVRREEPGSQYCQGIEETARYVRGYSERLNSHSWELHRPFPVVPIDVVSTLIPVLAETPRLIMPWWRTLYGVTRKDSGWSMDDPWTAKNYRPWGSSWISLGDGAWMDFGKRLSKWFPIPSPWEKS